MFKFIINFINKIKAAKSIYTMDKEKMEKLIDCLIKLGAIAMEIKDLLPGFKEDLLKIADKVKELVELLRTLKATKAKLEQ